MATDGLISDHVDVRFSDVINQPVSIAEHKVVRAVSKCTSLAYQGCQVGVYLVLQVVFGALLAVVWGFFYGVAIFFSAWLVHPFLRLFMMVFHCFMIPYKACVRGCCDPCYISTSYIFSNINFLHRMATVSPIEEVVVQQPNNDVEKSKHIENNV